METLITKRSNGVIVIKLNRPSYKNAINIRMMEELKEVIGAVKQDNEIKVVVFTGAENSFSSGGDLAQFHQMKTSEQVKPMLDKMGDVLNDIENVGKPTIAYVNGYALGGGAELAIACDFRFVNERAKIGFIQITLGLTTGWGSGLRLIEKLGRSKGLELLLTGEVLNANEAIKYGLADKVVNSLEEVVQYGEKIALFSLGSIQSYIQVANELKVHKDRDDIKRNEISRCSYLWETPEHEQAVERFLQKK